MAREEHDLGHRVRVVIERIQILNTLEPWFKGQGEFVFTARVRTRNLGEVDRRTRLPESGFYAASDQPGQDMIEVNTVVFDDLAVDEIGIEVSGLELDTFDPDDEVGCYRRAFRGDPASWAGAYGPADDAIDPEDMENWRLWYRIEVG
jgi:hypothetical protein